MDDTSNTNKAKPIRAVLDVIGGNRDEQKRLVNKIPPSAFGKGRHRILDKLVLVAIAASANSDGTSSFPSKETLAMRCLVSVRAIDNAIKRLVDRGLLVKESRGHQVRGTNKHTNLYTIKFPDLEQHELLLPVADVETEKPAEPAPEPEPKPREPLASHWLTSSRGGESNTNNGAEQHEQWREQREHWSGATRTMEGATRTSIADNRPLNRPSSVPPGLEESGETALSPDGAREAAPEDSPYPKAPCSRVGKKSKSRKRKTNQQLKDDLLQKMLQVSGADVVFLDWQLRKVVPVGDKYGVKLYMRAYHRFYSKYVGGTSLEENFLHRQGGNIWAETAEQYVRGIIVEDERAQAFAVAQQKPQEGASIQ